MCWNLINAPNQLLSIHASLCSSHDITGPRASFAALASVDIAVRPPWSVCSSPVGLTFGSQPLSTGHCLTHAIASCGWSSFAALLMLHVVSPGIAPDIPPAHIPDEWADSWSQGKSWHRPTPQLLFCAPFSCPLSWLPEVNPYFNQCICNLHDNHDPMWDVKGLLA